MIKGKRSKLGWFEPFKRSKLDALLEMHHISPSGRAYIEKALIAPARNVAGTTHNQVSDVPCPKMKWNSQAESASTENPMTLRLIFDSVVVGYSNQPPALSLCYTGRGGKTVRAPYTPDCIVFHWHEGVILEEWKPASAREHLEETYPGKFTKSENGEFVSEPVQRIVEPWGFKFRVRFSDEVTQIAHANRNFLFSYLKPIATEAFEPALPAIAEIFGQRLCVSYAALIEDGCDTDALNWALATSRLYFNFDSGLLERDPSDVLIFRHLESLQAWQLAIRPDGSNPKPPPKDFKPSRDLAAGDVVIFDGLRLTVNLVGKTTIHAMDSQRNRLVMHHDDLIASCRAGTLVFPEREGNKEVTSPFWTASLQALHRAVRKVDILGKVDRGISPDPQDRYSDSTYRRWRKQIEEGNARGWSAVESLIDDMSLRGFRGPHIAAEFSETLNSWIKEKLEDPKDLSVSAIYYELEKRAEHAGERMVAMSSFYERVKQIRSLRSIGKSQGHKHEYALQPSYWMLDNNTPIHCTRALELVHFDSTLLDIELRSSLSGEVLGRPWLSIAICANTRRVVGMYLSFQPPSQVSSLMLLYDMVRRFGRIPEAIIHDWGSEFKGKVWKYALTALSIIRHTRPKSAARFGAILERMFGIVTHEFIDNIAGNTKSRKNVRKLTPQSDPTNHSGLWLVDLFLALEEYFFDIYDNRKHPATLMSPRAGFDVSFLSHGFRPHQLRQPHDILPILMPTATGKPRIVDPARGLFVNYRYYGHPELTKLALKGSTVEVKPLLFDPGSVLAFLKGRWVICKSNLSERFSRCPEFSRQCIYEELRIEQRLVVMSEHLSRRRLFELQESLNRKALENVEYWNDSQANDVLDVADITEDTTTPQNHSKLSKIDQMMQLALSKVMHKKEKKL